MGTATKVPQTRTMDGEELSADDAWRTLRRYGRRRLVRDAVIRFRLGAVSTLVALTTAMGQIERGANRIYGLERDRPFHLKYGRAVLMALTAGTAMIAGFVILVAGRELGEIIAGVGYSSSMWNGPVRSATPTDR